MGSWLADTQRPDKRQRARQERCFRVGILRESFDTERQLSMLLVIRPAASLSLVRLKS